MHGVAIAQAARPQWCALLPDKGPLPASQRRTFFDIGRNLSDKAILRVTEHDKVSVVSFDVP